jgi:hypothetical protein
MQSKVRLVLPILVFPFLLGRPAAATTYRMMPDDALVDQAAAVVEVEVVSASSAPLVGQPATDYLVEVQRVLKGEVPGSALVVRVPGGVDPRGLGLQIWGAPQFAEGERALLFLRPAQDGTYRILQLMLGAFHERKAGGRTVALRDLSGAHDIAAKSAAEDGMDAVRDLDAFTAWIADIADGAAGARNPGRYVVGRANARPAPIDGKYVFLTPADGNLIRWFRFDGGESVQWKVNSAGQPGLGLDATIVAFQAGIAAWNAVAGTDIKYVYGGTTTDANGLTRSDGVNTILFDDPYRNDPAHAVAGTFSCTTGGVIAMGGPFFDASETRIYRSQRYHEAIEADIVTNDGTQCLFQNNPSAAAEVFTHELGHTLGLGHSLNPQAIMFASVHNDGRGAQLSDDDRAGVSVLYGDGTVTGGGSGGGGGGDGGGGGSVTLVAPVRLAGHATSRTAVALSWRDKAKGEESYVVEVKANVRGAVFQVAATVPAGATAAQVTGLNPRTTYDFRVRAVAGDQSSPYSKVVVVTTPR